MKQWKMQFVISSNSNKTECFEFEMIIDNFSKFNEVSHSPSFTTTRNCKTSWQIILEVNSGAKKMRVALKRTDSNIVYMRGSMFFEIQNEKKEVYWRDSVENLYTAHNPNYCFCDYIKIPICQDDVSGKVGKAFVLPADILVIKGYVLVKEQKFSNPNHAIDDFLNKNQEMLKCDYTNLYRSQKFSDIALVFPDGTLRAHKNILSSRSQVFQEILEQNRFQNEIEINFVEKSVFEIFLVFLYSGTIENKDIDTVMSLYTLAYKYKVSSLIKTCSSVLTLEITPSAALRIMDLARKQGDAILRDACMDFICEKFAQVSKTKEWDILLTSDTRFATLVLRRVSKIHSHK